MITEEMVEKAEDAVYHALPWSSFWSSCEARELVRAALEAAYPLIAGQVLEEAALTADAIAVRSIWHPSALCHLAAVAIRALKAKYEVSK